MIVNVTYAQFKSLIDGHFTDGLAYTLSSGNVVTIAFRDSIISNGSTNPAYTTIFVLSDPPSFSTFTSDRGTTAQLFEVTGLQE